jgi:hypothetical protein
MFKFMRVDPCAKLTNLLNNMFLIRFVQVFLDDKSSRWRSLNNGLSQGSVLAPLLFSLYLSDIPSTLSNQFQYAKHESFSDCEANLEVDLEQRKKLLLALTWCGNWLAQTEEQALKHYELLHWHLSIRLLNTAVRRVVE